MFCTDIPTLDINDVKSAVCSEPDFPVAVLDQMRGESESVGSNLSWPSMKVEWKELLQSKLSGLVGETSHCWAGVIGRPTPPQYFAALLLLLS